MHVPSFVSDVAAGTLSGAFVAYLPLRHRNIPSASNTIAVTGGGNALVDQSRHQSWTITHNTMTTRITPASRSRPAQSDSEDSLILVALAGLAAVIGFLFIWPLALGFLLGSCLIVAGAYVRAASSRILKPVGLQGRAVAQSALVVTLTAATCGFAFFTSADGHGLVNLERELANHFPGYSTAIPTRWNVLSHHTSEVFDLIGWRGGLILFSQVAALILCSLITAMLAIRALGAVGLLQQVSGRRIGKVRQNLAARLLTEQPGTDIAIIGSTGAIALFLASGLAAHLLMHGMADGPKLSALSASITSKEESR